MIREISAKTLLTRMKSPASWFGVTYNMNIYRGCQHGCIYCDSRSQCYGIENFEDVLVKVNSIALLKKELSGKRKVATIGTGSMSDPYTPVEKHLNFTGRALEVIENYGFPAHIVTKSDLILRDAELIRSISRVFASVAFTLTTADDSLAAIIEPGAPRPSARLDALRQLADAGVYTGILMMPVLPYIEDTKENIEAVVRQSHSSGASFIIPWLGMSLRDRQREYYFSKLDLHFPGLRRKYEKEYSSLYSCAVKSAGELYSFFGKLCEDRGMTCDMKNVRKYNGNGGGDCFQPSLFHG
ncbi:MAG: radical SAM protein [Peptococcaceae bacterium BICA1-7]|nr:MAG: radical SAM protein [Peptococcaceae bacterium BICA1-7]HBV99425.1 radical SAM protein [Desulfotomaculum sp.]